MKKGLELYIEPASFIARAKNQINDIRSGMTYHGEVRSDGYDVRGTYSVDVPRLHVVGGYDPSGNLDHETLRTLYSAVASCVHAHGINPKNITLVDKTSSVDLGNLKRGVILSLASKECLPMLKRAMRKAA